MRYVSLALLLVASIAHADQLADQLAEEQAVVDKTIAIVDDKLAIANAQRLERARAAYRMLHDRSPDHLTAARRRAATRWLLERDKRERDLLAAEAKQLEAGQQTIRAAIAKLPTLALPAQLVRPVKGSIARKFGTIVHEASKATLARRGLDFEVADDAVVTAPADGVVRYAGPIRGLDSGVILDHGDYMTVVAKLGEVSLPIGTKLVAGDRLGHAARHRVYLEVRVKAGPGGLPIDPEPLLRSRE